MNEDNLNYYLGDYLRLERYPNKFNLGWIKGLCGWDNLNKFNLSLCWALWFWINVDRTLVKLGSNWIPIRVKLLS